MNRIPAKAKELRAFALRSAIGMSVFGTILLVRGSERCVFFYGAAAAVVVCYFAAPRAVELLSTAMAGVVRVVGSAVKWTALPALFFLIFTPVGLLMRLSGKDLLRRRIEKSAASYWIESEKASVPPAAYERQF